MTKDEYRLILQRLDLTQLRAAELLGIDARTSRHWALGERRVSGPAAILLRLLAARPELIGIVEGMRYETDIKAPGGAARPRKDKPRRRQGSSEIEAQADPAQTAGGPDAEREPASGAEI
jgi:hypothetical protein